MDFHHLKKFKKNLEIFIQWLLQNNILIFNVSYLLPLLQFQFNLEKVLSLFKRERTIPYSLPCSYYSAKK